MKNRHVAGAGSRMVERQHVAGQLGLDVNGIHIGRVAQLPEELPDAARVVAHRIAVVGVGKPLVDDHDALRSTSAAG